MAGKKMDDLGMADRSQLSWEDGKAASALQTLFERVTSQADRAVTWYVESRRLQRGGAVRLRVGAIILVAVAGITPILAQMFPHIEVTSKARILQIDPALATVFLGVAALLVLLDKFLGYSSAWMRFAAAEMNIRHLMQEFEVDWESGRAACCGVEPTPEQAQAALDKLKAFVTQLNTIIKQETQAWIDEFGRTLAQIDAAAQPKSAKAAAGASNE